MVAFPLIEGRLYEPETRGGELTRLAGVAAARLQGEAGGFTGAARESRGALHRGLHGLAQLAGQTDRLDGEVGVHDPGREASRVGDTLIGPDPIATLERSLPQHPGEAAGPPPGDFLVDQAAGTARSVPGEAAGWHRRSPRYDDEADYPHDPGRDRGK